MKSPIPTFGAAHIASDFLATSLQEQDSNLRWLRDLLQRPISSGLGVSVEIASATFSSRYQFNREKFFAMSDIHVDKTATHVFVSANQVSDASLTYLKETFPEQMLIVGYELSEGTRAVLERANISYIDLWLHPIRFLDDIFMAMRSNIAAVNTRLENLELPEEQCYVQADLLRVQNYRGFRRFSNELIPDSTVFIGQLLEDKAVLCEHGMLSLLDYKNEFSKLANTCEHLYYSRHPFLKEGDEKILAYVKSFRNASISNLPAYHLLASDEIRNIAAISSSVVSEAKYFGKNTIYFSKPTVPIYCGGGYYSIFHDYLIGGFWRYILACDPSDRYSKNIMFRKDMLRDTLSWYWSYRQIDKLETVRASVGQLLAKK